MSVIVKGMKVPEYCSQCKFFRNRNGNCWCKALESGMRFEEILNGRREDCPLVELIRCKDCKYMYTECGMRLCEKLDSLFYNSEDQESIDADFYCKWAERRKRE